MTHFTVGILIPADQLPLAEEYIALQMASYNENKQVEPYICYDLDQAADDLKRETSHMERIIETRSPHYDLDRCREHLQRLQQMTPEARYREFVQRHNTFDEDSNPISTYNPQSRWDWYVIGGRWDGWLHDRETSTNTIADNSAPIFQILANGKWTYALITPDGQWHECGKMGWWAIAANEKEEAAWQEEQSQILARYRDHYLVLIDAHI